MKSLRMLGVLLVAVFAFGVVGVSVAAAEAPEFNPGTTQAFSFTSGTSILTATGQKVVCVSDRGTGEITGVDSVSNVHITFIGCKVTDSKGTCSINSIKPQGTAGLIDTVTLKGNLGKVAKAEAASEVGLLLEPVSGSTYTTLEATGAPCESPETAVTGKIAGEVKPINTKQLTGTITVATSGGKQKIKEINVLGKGFEKIASLNAFGTPATEETTENIQFEKALEVT